MIADVLHTLKEQLPADVQLVAVSKFHPVERLMEAYEAGQRVFAESRPQELDRKVPQMPEDVQWHFIGHLQTNKLKLVLPHVCLVQSVDSLHLLQAIDAWGALHNCVIDILLELHLGSEATKQGFSEEEILSILAQPFANIRIRGLMGMATNTDDMAVVDQEFAKIEDLYNRIRREGRPDFDQLSIGMSADWPVAIRHQATMVRIGTDIFGTREY